MKTISLSIPDSIDLSDRDAKMLLASRLFEKGKLTLGQASEMVGLSKTTFMELLADYGKSISELKAELDEEFGKYFYQRNDVHTTEEKKLNALELCNTLKAGDEFGGKKIISIETLDGFKFFFENGWIIVRASGTEPLLRIYCETIGTDETTDTLSKAINQLNL